jgi:predicted nucleic acid-binding protein
MADAGEIRIDISEFIIDEVLPTLRKKFEWSAERLQEAADQMTAIARKVAPSRTVDVLKGDPTDNRILECAAQAKSEYLVTGDRGLLSLGSFEDIPIVRVADSWRLSRVREKAADRRCPPANGKPASLSRCCCCGRTNCPREMAGNMN